ncbi:MAG: recombination regulator RecX [Pseudomonadota bacterium]
MEQQPPSSKPKRNGEPTPRTRALRLLARRDYTRVELERKLAPRVEPPADLQSLLDELADQGWLSETRAVEQLVHAKRSRLGSARIRQSLIGKGVSPELIASTLRALNDTELTAAREVWARKFNQPPDTPAARARQVRFLQYRGFSTAIAMRVIRGADSDDGE